MMLWCHLQQPTAQMTNQRQKSFRIAIPHKFGGAQYEENQVAGIRPAKVGAPPGGPTCLPSCPAGPKPACTVSSLPLFSLCDELACFSPSALLCRRGMGAAGLSSHCKGSGSLWAGRRARPLGLEKPVPRVREWAPAVEVPPNVRTLFLPACERL